MKKKTRPRHKNLHFLLEYIKPSKTMRAQKSCLKRSGEETRKKMTSILFFSFSTSKIVSNVLHNIQLIN